MLPDCSDWASYIGQETPRWLGTKLQQERISLPDLSSLPDPEFLAVYLGTLLRLRAILLPGPFETA